LGQLVIRKIIKILPPDVTCHFLKSTANATGKTLIQGEGALKMREWKMQEWKNREWKMQEQIAGVWRVSE